MASAWAMILDRGETLLVRRACGRGRAGQWCPPGGRIKSGESAADACVREAFEETGLAVVVERELAVYPEATFFLCGLADAREKLTPRREECTDAVWVRPTAILTVGEIMDLRRIGEAWRRTGIAIPAPPAAS